MGCGASTSGGQDSPATGASPRRSPHLRAAESMVAEAAGQFGAITPGKGDTCVEYCKGAGQRSAIQAVKEPISGLTFAQLCGRIIVEQNYRKDATVSQEDGPKTYMNSGWKMLAMHMAMEDIGSATIADLAGHSEELTASSPCQPGGAEEFTSFAAAAIACRLDPNDVEAKLCLVAAAAADSTTEEQRRLVLEELVPLGLTKSKADILVDLEPLEGPPESFADVTTTVRHLLSTSKISRMRAFTTGSAIAWRFWTVLSFAASAVPDHSAFAFGTRVSQAQCAAFAWSFCGEAGDAVKARLQGRVVDLVASPDSVSVMTSVGIPEIVAQAPQVVLWQLGVTVMGDNIKSVTTGWKMAPECASLTTKQDRGEVVVGLCKGADSRAVTMSTMYDIGTPAFLQDEGHKCGFAVDALHQARPAVRDQYKDFKSTQGDALARAIRAMPNSALPWAMLVFKLDAFMSLPQKLDLQEDGPAPAVARLCDEVGQARAAAGFPIAGSVFESELWCGAVDISGLTADILDAAATALHLLDDDAANAPHAPLVRIAFAVAAFRWVDVVCAVRLRDRTLATPDEAFLSALGGRGLLKETATKTAVVRLQRRAVAEAAVALEHASLPSTQRAKAWYVLGTLLQQATVIEESFGSSGESAEANARVRGKTIDATAALESSAKSVATLAKELAAARGQDPSTSVSFAIAAPSSVAFDSNDLYAAMAANLAAMDATCEAPAFGGTQVTARQLAERILLGDCGATAHTPSSLFAAIRALDRADGSDTDTIKLRQTLRERDSVPVDITAASLAHTCLATVLHSGVPFGGGACEAVAFYQHVLDRHLSDDRRQFSIGEMKVTRASLLQVLAAV